MLLYLFGILLIVASALIHERYYKIIMRIVIGIGLCLGILGIYVGYQQPEAAFVYIVPSIIILVSSFMSLLIHFIIKKLKKF